MTKSSAAALKMLSEEIRAMKISPSVDWICAPVRVRAFCMESLMGVVHFPKTERISDVPALFNDITLCRKGASNFVCIRSSLFGPQPKRTAVRRAERRSLVNIGDPLIG